MWISSNPNVVSVSGGAITGETLGSAVITAIASDGSSSATCKVTVASKLGTNNIRLGGDNRYDTSVAISKSGWQNGSAYAVIATGNDYPDALSAAPLARKYNAPILLTDTNSIPQVTLDEIERLKTNYIFICGGTSAVSQSVENQLNTMGIVTERLKGTDRYGTSAAIAEELGVSSGELMVANGYDWSDALSASSIAAKMGIPILLTDKDTLPDSINSFISKRSFSKTYILGDVDLISSNVSSRFPSQDRIVGITAYERNINIIKRFQNGLDLSNICIATGRDFPDALSGSALAATLNSAIVLVDNNGLQDTTTQYAAQYLAQTNNVYVFGLQNAVNDSIISKLFSR
jgi:putative cell wall-binding protein